MVPTLTILDLFLSSSFNNLTFEDNEFTALLRIYDSDISLDFFRYIDYYTGRKN